MNDLPIISSCDNCGACCLEQQSPPGYAMLLSSQKLMDEADLFADDVKRLQELPEEAVQELRDYITQLLNGSEPEDPACIWLDRETMRCRYHEHRPMICREFEIGSEECLTWRRVYNIIEPTMADSLLEESDMTEKRFVQGVDWDFFDVGSGVLQVQRNDEVETMTDDQAIAECRKHG